MRILIGEYSMKTNIYLICSIVLNYNFDDTHSFQIYYLYNGKIAQIQKMQIIMPNSATDNFTKTYR